MYDFLNDNKVSVYCNKNITSYPQNAPYNPSNIYPEYQFDNKQLSNDNNDVYDAVRNLLHLLNMDNNNYGTAIWNPFKEIIQPGNKVVIKPNFVLDKHVSGGNMDAVITHPSVIRAVVDYVYIALQGKGEIVIGDAPQADADFDNLLNITKIQEIKKMYKDIKEFEINILDFRQLKFVYSNGVLTKESRIMLDGDPLGYTVVNLSNDSEFAKLDSFDKLYGADYDRNETIKHHNKGKNEYCIANTVLAADVIISIPKMKTHRKGGVTLNLKNLVGINGNKNYLPHFKIGTPEDGGDEYPQLNKQQKTAFYTQRLLTDKLLAKPSFVKEKFYGFAEKMYKIIKPIFFREVSATKIQNGGGWYGNDTIWRMVLDLNKILIYGDKNGNLSPVPQRKFFNIVDGIIAGEGDGPLMPDAKVSGIVAGGTNFLLVDLVLIRIMGFDADKIPQYSNHISIKKFKLTNINATNIEIYSNDTSYKDCLINMDDSLMSFKAASGWVGHIEI